MAQRAGFVTTKDVRMKQLNLVSRAIVLFVCASIVGCGDTVPKCGDEDTISLVKQIASKQIAELGDLTENEVVAQLSLEYPRASSFDAAIKKYECEGRLISAGTYQLPITYETQLDDNGEQIVAVSGMQRGDLYMMANAAAAGVAKYKAEVAKSQLASRPTVAAVPLATAPPNVPVAKPSQVQVANAPPSVPERTLESSSPSYPAESETSPGASTVGKGTSANVAPSFNCENAGTAVEHSICGNDEIAGKDARLARIYLSMMRAEDDPEAKASLRADQRAFIERRDECSSDECLNDVYSNRLEDICAAPGNQECP